jgi:TonB dependent receptor/TonB-dependent Receptor Plug Domain
VTYTRSTFLISGPEARWGFGSEGAWEFTMRKVGTLCLMLALAFFALQRSGFGQANHGELRLKVTDPAGLGVRTSVRIVSEANGYRNTLDTDDEGTLIAQRLPYGVYNLEIKQPGFAHVLEIISVRSSVPLEYKLELRLSAVGEVVNVEAQSTLVNPEQAGSVSQIGSEEIRTRVMSVPGRTMQDLVNDQPGWLYEGNAVLHPRGSEYQTQFVVDGIPLTDNRSPGSGPELEGDDVQSVSIYTAGIPAEYGRKMGGVIEVNTLQDAQAGFHGNVALSGGSFDSAGVFAQGQYVWGKNAFGASASGSMSDHYLNPVVPENYTNTGTLGDFSAHYERDLTPQNRLNLIVRHEFARYELPNEQVQQTPHLDSLDPSLPLGSQLETASNIETMGIASYQHTFSSNMVADLHAMVRDKAINFNSNDYATPIEVFQNNGFREGYVRGTISVTRGRHEWKAGFETDNATLNENFRYAITNPTLFGPDTPPTFSFAANRPDLEQSAFVQDRIRLGKWTVSAGLRWDHYQLLLNRNAVQPRLAVSRYVPSADLLLHFSYDRVFQTPSFENILLSSSTAVESIDPTSFLRLPVQPSEGNYFELGMTKGFAGKLRVDANYYRRYVGNYADDDQIQNTAISFPIAFRKSVIYGAETKIDLPEWRRFSGFLSYSYMVGNVWYPVTGGLFLGGDAQGIPTSGHFPDSQDQRHALRGRLRYQVHPRFWVAGGVQYDSGLPFEFQCDPTLPSSQCIAQEVQTYGQPVVDRINFTRQRIFPAFQVNASAGADLYKSDRIKMRFQADGQNLTNVLDVIDFGGLFSGNAIGPSRSFTLRLTAAF